MLSFRAGGLAVVLAAALGLSAGGGCMNGWRGPTGPSPGEGFAEVARELYPYRASTTAEGHRRLGSLIRQTRDPGLRVAACYHYLRASLDVAALAFYPIAAADGRPDRLLPIAQMIRRMPLDHEAAAICSAVPRSLGSGSAWMAAWGSLSQLVDALSAGRRGAPPSQYHAALRRLASVPDGMGMRARFHLVGGCLASYFTAFRAAGRGNDPWESFAAGCGYVDGTVPIGISPKVVLGKVFDRMASDLRRSIGHLPEDPFSAFAVHQLATVVAVRQQLGQTAEYRQVASSKPGRGTSG